MCEVCVIVDEAMHALGEILIQHFPATTTGDLSPERKVALTEALDAAITEWIGNNAVDYGA